MVRSTHRFGASPFFVPPFVPAFAVSVAAAALLLAAAPQTARAQTNVVVPNALANTEGNAANTFLTSIAARTYQTQIAASQLTTVFQTGDQIGGISFRLDNAATAPPGDLIYSTNFQVTLSQAANAISSFSTTFADNIGANAATVYKAPLTFAASSFSSQNSNTTPEAFGPTITFSSAYIYQGGDLVITVIHDTGSRVINLDATNSSQTGNTTLVAIGANSPDATIGATVSPIVLRLNGVTATVGPEPGSLSLLGMGLFTGAGMLGGVRRRRLARKSGA